MIPTPKDLALQKLAHVEARSVDRAVENLYPPIQDKGHAKTYAHRGNYKFTQVLNSTEVHVNPAAMKLALEMAGGDRSRLELCPDGGIIIWNSREHKSRVREARKRKVFAAVEESRKHPELLRPRPQRTEEKQLTKVRTHRFLNTKTAAEMVAEYEAKAMPAKDLAAKYGVSQATLFRHAAKNKPQGDKAD